MRAPQDPNGMANAELVVEAIAAWRHHEEARRAAELAARHWTVVESVLARRHHDAIHGRGNLEADFYLAACAIYCDRHVIAFVGDGVTVTPAIDVTRLVVVPTVDAPPADPRAWRPVTDEPMF